MAEDVIISYRGARYEIGRGPSFYGIWPAGAAAAQAAPAPVEWWPLTPEGWFAAWSRFSTIETPGSIFAIGPAGPGPAPGPSGIFPAGPAAPAEPATTASFGSASFAGPAFGTVPPGASPSGDSAQPDATPRAAALSPHARRDRVIAAALLGVGVVLAIAGLFPAYFTGSSLASQAAQVIPHIIYLVAWAASAVLIVGGGTRLRIGALLGLGTSIVTFGLFFADVGSVINGGAHLIGAGLVLSIIGWVVSAAGSVLAFRLRSAGAMARPRAGTGQVLVLVLATLAALGAAAAFAPSWDSFTLHTAAGATESLTAGNAFDNPGPVIAGDVIVMVALVVVAVGAALWIPIREGAALLAGAIVPLLAQAISALAQLGQGTSPEQFGISSSQAAQAGLTIDAGLTAAFWIFCVFVIALIATAARMAFPPHPHQVARDTAAPIAPPAASPLG